MEGIQNAVQSQNIYFVVWRAEPKISSIFTKTQISLAFLCDGLLRGCCGVDFNIFRKKILSFTQPFFVGGGGCGGYIWTFETTDRQKSYHSCARYNSYFSRNGALFWNKTVPTFTYWVTAKSVLMLTIQYVSMVDPNPNNLQRYWGDTALQNEVCPGSVCVTAPNFSSSAPSQW